MSLGTLIETQVQLSLEPNPQDPRQGRITAHLTVDGIPYEVLHVAGPMYLVQQYFEGTLTLDQYSEAIARRPSLWPQE